MTNAFETSGWPMLSIEVEATAFNISGAYNSPNGAGGLWPPAPFGEFIIMHLAFVMKTEIYVHTRTDIQHVHIIHQPAKCILTRIHRGLYMYRVARQLMRTRSAHLFLQRS